MTTVPESPAGARDDRAIVFDFGRVLFRWRPEVLVATALPHRAAQAAPWAAQIFQGYEGDWLEFDRGTADVPTLARRIAARTGLPDAEVRAVIAAAPAELQPLPDTAAWVRRLQAGGRPLHYLSNMPIPFAEHLEQAHDVLQAFESGVFSGRIGLVKPDPAIFAHAATVYGRPAAALLLVDDVPANIQAARAAGWRGVLFENAAQAEREVAALGWQPGVAPG